MHRRIVKRFPVLDVNKDQSEVNQSDNSLSEPVWPSRLHPVLRRVYANRQISTAEDLDYSLKHLLPYSGLKGIDKATSLLVQALEQGKNIVFIGDFDADGATSTALGVGLLRKMVAGSGARVSYIVPDRFRFGYGLSPEIVDLAKERGAELIITVDNGISSIDGVKRARQLDIDVLVTDHHLAGAELPDANAIVNPNQPGDHFASKAMAGVGVIFYTLLALRAALRDLGWFEKHKIEEPNMAAVLDIVALGTVADVVPLDRNNRILVDQGLRRIRSQQACPGIMALLEVSGRKAESIAASDMGFSLGPRLNAAGRLEDMSIGIECLLSRDMAIARVYAKQLHELNQERKEIEQEMKTQALETMNELHLDDEGVLPLGLCLYNETWHQGVIGILASRIKDKTHRPVIALANSSENEVKGSARSIEGLHIRDVLEQIANQNPGLLSKYGGHAMAAGLSMPRENLERFRTLFAEVVFKKLDGQEPESVSWSDGELDEQHLTLELAQQLRNAGPWGQSFPEPMFDGLFEVVEQRIVGSKHLKLVLRHKRRNAMLDAIAFNALEEENAPSPFQTGSLNRFLYRLDVNEFRGRRTLQLFIEALAVDSTETFINESNSELENTNLAKHNTNNDACVPL